MVRIGTAGWTIPPPLASHAPGSGSHLERYAGILHCAEINSSFHRSHRLSTWTRWAASTPPAFRFSAKLPKAITHVAKLVVESSAFDSFVAETTALSERLGAVLVQLPPSLAFEDCPAVEFFEALRERFPETNLALEPRHRSWFARDADALLHQHRIARVAADPLRDPRLAAGALPTCGGWPRFAYYRLHGSPRMYYSSYEPGYLARLAAVLREQAAAHDTWVIFDNTAAGQAFGDALVLAHHLQEQEKSTPATGPQKPRRGPRKPTRDATPAGD